MHDRRRDKSWLMKAGDRSLAMVPCAVNRFGPDAGQRFRMLVPGAALCVMPWAISSVAFSFYLADYGVTYGSRDDEGLVGGKLAVKTTMPGATAGILTLTA